MKNRQQASFEKVAKEICSGNEEFTRQLYKGYKPKFVSWFMKQYKLNQQESLEVYHQSFLVLYYQIKQERLTSLMSTLETYLFGIGKKLMLKEQVKQRNFLDLAEADLVSTYDPHENEEQVHKKMLVRQILKRVTEPCKSILTMYYYREYSLESIAFRLGYKNSGTVKKKKSLCLKHIREQLSTKLIKNGTH